MEKMGIYLAIIGNLPFLLMGVLLKMAQFLQNWQSDEN